MKLSSIAFVIPYFCEGGHLPNTFRIWLKSCKHNSTIDWYLYTDDRTRYDYPANVHVTYIRFSEFIDLLQSLFDFPIGIKSPKKLCDFKVAYGDLLKDELEKYDYWGYCDLDIIWGNLRTFYTEEILHKYDKIGYTGNCTIYKNTRAVNTLYRQENHRGEILYKKYFSDDHLYCFDEVGINDIFSHHQIPCYTRTNFSNLASMRPDFHMCFLPNNEKYKNKFVIYCWKHGELFHVYLHKDLVLYENIMFLHFLGSRNIEIKTTEKEEKFLVVPNRIIPWQEVTPQLLKEKTTGLWTKYIKTELSNRKTITAKVFWLLQVIRYNYWAHFKSQVFNYWLWTNYDEDKKDRLEIIKNRPEDF